MHADVLYQLVSSARPESSKHPPVSLQPPLPAVLPCPLPLPGAKIDTPVFFSPLAGLPLPLLPLFPPRSRLSRMEEPPGVQRAGGAHRPRARGAARGLTVSCAGIQRVLGLEGARIVRRGLDCGIEGFWARSVSVAAGCAPGMREIFAGID